MKLLSGVLPMRVATLLCILSGQRSPTLSVSSTTFINHADIKITFPLESVLKQSRPDYHQEPLEFLVYDKDPRICPVFNIKMYIEKTKAIRGEEKGFFLSYVPPHKAVSSKTTARWVSSFFVGWIQIMEHTQQGQHPRQRLQSWACLWRIFVELMDGPRHRYSDDTTKNPSPLTRTLVHNCWMPTKPVHSFYMLCSTYFWKSYYTAIFGVCGDN